MGKIILSSNSARRIVHVGTPVRLVNKQVVRRVNRHVRYGHLIGTVDTACSATEPVIVTCTDNQKKYSCTSPLSKDGDTFDAGQKVLFQQNLASFEWEIINSECPEESSSE